MWTNTIQPGLMFHYSAFRICSIRSYLEFEYFVRIEFRLDVPVGVSLDLFRSEKKNSYRSAMECRLAS